METFIWLEVAMKENKIEKEKEKGRKRFIKSEFGSQAGLQDKLTAWVTDNEMGRFLMKWDQVTPHRHILHAVNSKNKNRKKEMSDDY